MIVLGIICRVFGELQVILVFLGDSASLDYLIKLAICFPKMTPSIR